MCSSDLIAFGPKQPKLSLVVSTVKPKKADKLLIGFSVMLITTYPYFVDLVIYDSAQPKLKRSSK